MLNIKRHIIRGYFGTEENVKIKIIIPLLERLGWDIISDCFFEEHKADILVEFSGKPAFIIETKGWTQDFHYGQGLEYSIKTRTPWVVFTSGQFTEIHHALVLRNDLAKPRPVFAVAFSGLSEDPDQLGPLLSLRAFKSGFPALHERLRPRLPAHQRNLTADELAKAFANLCHSTDFNLLSRSQRTVELDDALAQLPTGVEIAYRRLLLGLEQLAEGSSRLRCRRSGLAFNLEALDPKRESMGRLKWLGLLGVFPDRQTTSKGLANWKTLGLSDARLAELKQLTPPSDEAAAEKFVSVIRGCLDTVRVI